MKTAEQFDQFTAAMGVLGSLVGQTADDARIKAWWLVLGHIPHDVLLQAMLRVMESHKFPNYPLPSSVLEACDEILHGTSMTHGEAFKIAFDAMMKFSLSGREQARAAMGEDVWETVEQIGGYTERLCEVKTSEIGTLAAQFRSAWEAKVIKQRQQRITSARESAKLSAPSQLRVKHAQ